MVVLTRLKTLLACKIPVSYSGGGLCLRKLSNGTQLRSIGMSVISRGSGLAASKRDIMRSWGQREAKP